MVPSTRQIEQQVSAVLAHDAEARILGIQAARPGAWPERIRVRARDFRLAWCDSPLAAREALLASDPGTEGLILLTNANDQALGADILARLARGRVFRLQSWELVRDLFQARDIDPRLGKLKWIADLLVERAPAAGYAPAPGGFLCADAAWQQVLGLSLGITDPRPDALALVEWTLREDASARMQALADPMRTDLAGWVAGVAGPAGRPIIACVVAGKGADCLPLGLLCELLFREGAQADPTLSAATARLERFTEGQRVEPLGGQRWAEAAVAALARLNDRSRVRALLARADVLLADLGLTAAAEASDCLQAGFDARLGRYAESLATAVPTPRAPQLAQVEAAAARVLTHGQAVHQGARCARVQMALRLLRWLASPEDTPGDFPAAAQSYTQEGSFVDWARMTLLGGDDLGELSAAYAGLALAVRARRERLNGRFAELLPAWNAAGSAAEGAGLVPVEGIIGSVLAPLAAQCPTLLLVADGMSLPVLRALTASLTALGWTAVAPTGGLPAVAGVAVLPTVTESSRTSLLCGRLTLGNASQETSGFSTHPALLAVSRPTARPLLFHKSELGDGSGLSDAVREALRARDQRVVGVVYNAVDDHLSGSDQLHQTWSVDDLRLLGPLLHEARLAGRAIVITADHGHVLDEGTTLRSHEDGDRWRRGPGPSATDEIELGGGRVLAPGGYARVILPWSEGVRYACKKNGYHGGATPQEVLVPLVVLVSAAQEVAGWTLFPPALPQWWETAPSPGLEAEPAMGLAVPTETPPIPPGKRRKVPLAQGDLFLALATPPADDGWVERLLASAVYAEQKRLAARIAPTDQDLRRFLLALDSRGGKLGKTALAQRLGMPLVRIGGFLSAIRRVLNVDRAAVVSIDEAAGEVEFNRGLLDVQFQLKGP
ncbi:BREX-2 system phosphatase PglZ [Lamprocystis purpurea]|uniref:BREX-2 system phosphatase PglZ n=1 Tax=Lamprocystis purpurea TaxID=61598 RepID=UPI00039F4993|nr:BREX-2 system phosphatase PglZ [Lamprocystis purpurea]